jgi:hypothetical protein
MDCKTARLLLEFARPHHPELDPVDLRAIEAHVGSCPDCSLAAKHERDLDEQLAQAMRQVDVPDRLRARLLTRLADERDATRKWRWKRVVGGAVAVAATLLLAIGGWVVYHRAMLPPLDQGMLDSLAGTAKRQDGLSPQDIESDFRGQGIEMTAPTSLNYAFLAFHGLGKLEKQQVPCLIFIRDDPDTNIHAHAFVYVVSDREFSFKDPPTNYQSEPGYVYKVELEYEAGSHYAYVIVHTGDNLDWLRRPQ